MYVYINICNIPTFMFNITNRRNFLNSLTAGVNIFIEHIVVVRKCFKMGAPLRIRNTYFDNFNSKEMLKFQKVSSCRVEMLHTDTEPFHQRHRGPQQRKN